MKKIMVATLLCGALVFTLVAHSTVVRPISAEKQHVSKPTTTVEPVVKMTVTEVTVPTPINVTDHPITRTTIEVTIEPETATESIRGTVIPEGTDCITEVTPIPEPTIDKGNDTAAKVTGTFDEQIKKILDHYLAPGPDSLPAAMISDPISLPDMDSTSLLAYISHENMTVHGMSRLKVHNVSVDVNNAQVNMLLKLQRMDVIGNYTIDYWGSSRQLAKPFNISLIDVDSDMVITLEPDLDDCLQITETKTDMRFGDCELDFENLGYIDPEYYDRIRILCSDLFDVFKQDIIGEVNNVMTSDINARIQ